MPIATSAMAAHAVGRATSLQGGRGRDGDQDRAGAGDPQADGVLGRSDLVGPPDGVDDVHSDTATPVAPPGLTDPGEPEGATARASRRPAARRSATSASTRPDVSVVASSTGVPRSRRATTVPRARSATRSASSGSAGRATTTLIGSAAAPSASRTISSPVWAVARQWTWRRLSPGR